MFVACMILWTQERNISPMPARNIFLWYFMMNLYFPIIQYSENIVFGLMLTWLFPVPVCGLFLSAHSERGAASPSVLTPRPSNKLVLCIQRVKASVEWWSISSLCPCMLKNAATSWLCCSWASKWFRSGCQAHSQAAAFGCQNNMIAIF